MPIFLIRKIRRQKTNSRGCRWLDFLVAWCGGGMGIFY